MQMKKLNLQQVLHLNEELVLIEQMELGDWFVDHADGVYTLYDTKFLYLENSDKWLDCENYQKVWVAYRLLEEMV